MNASTPDPTTATRSREVRLGLVMYGGVSLAIYINGVAREFHRAVRGESVYKLIKALTDSDIVVDIISGTSAGGVNGVLLGYALANGTEFAPTAQLWRQAGSLDKLMRSPGSGSGKVLSVLDGEGYYQPALEGAFAAMDRSPASEADCEPSPVSELDVFVTSTDVDGNVYTWVDAHGHAVDVKDHRAAFRLQRRGTRKNDFRLENAAALHPALAKLCRMTSCFPAAFPPVRLAVEPGQDDPEGRTRWNAWLNDKANRTYWKQWQEADRLLARWGRVGKLDSYFLDGGLLDNKPFTYTINEIFHRLAHRAVERRLFYIEPDPETFDHDTPATEVDAVSAVQRALLTIPGYESIAGDLRELTHHNERIERYRRLIGQDPDKIDGVKALIRAKQSIDQESQAFIARMQAREDGEQVDIERGETWNRYANCRLVTLSERAVHGILKRGGQAQRLDKAATAKASQLLKAFDDWDSAKYQHAEGEATLHTFDVYFRLRRMFHLMYAVKAPPLGGGPVAELRSDVRLVIGAHIQALEVVRYAMERLVDDGEFDWMGKDRDPVDIWDTLRKAYDELLKPVGSIGAGQSLDEKSIADLHRELSDRLKLIWPKLTADAYTSYSVDGADSVLLAIDRSLRSRLIELDQRAVKLAKHGSPATVLFDAPEAIPAPPQDSTQQPPKPLADAFRDFIYFDADLFTLETFADLREKDVIRTVRISPKDAQRGRYGRDLAAKVSGDAVFHFGGFFKRSWRANDILWGRMDGACQLIETLMDQERVTNVLATPGVAAALKARIAAGGDLSPDKLFPRAPAAVRAKLDAWLASLIEAGTLGTTLEEGAFDKGITALVEAAQCDFLGDEIGNVLEDATEEQLEWNYGRETVGLRQDLEASTWENPKWAFQVGPQRFDGLVRSVVSTDLVRRTREMLSRGEDADRFFVEKYAVGKETIATDVPVWILLELTFKGLLVAKDAIVYSLPEAWRGNVVGSLPFRVVSWVLKGMYALAWTLRSGKRVQIALRFLLAGLLVMAVVTAITLRQGYLCEGSHFRPLALFSLVAPTALLSLSFGRWLMAISIAAAGVLAFFWKCPLC
ncbi:MAG: patatin-like protein [Gammaproteobacteria bacterium]|nr:patatin-like protein [Gammaproteobacteria bacterium]